MKWAKTKVFLMGMAVAFGIIVLMGADNLEPKEEPVVEKPVANEIVGRYQLAVGGEGYGTAYVIDTMTGRVKAVGGDKRREQFDIPFETMNNRP
ncbi:MAG: hypothetical protein QGH40_02440 [bacterium]|jgi:hypothetical protein|nr:hypothetical protein [bacterium]